MAEAAMKEGAPALQAAGCAEEAVQFAVAGYRLYGILHLPDRPARGLPFVLMVVGGPQTRVGSHRSYLQVARGLAREGVRVLRFDYRGIGDADGGWVGYTQSRASIRAALDLIRERFPDAGKTVIWALCDGAAASMVFSRWLKDRVDGMILCNPYVHSDAGRAEAIIKGYYLRRFTDRDFWLKVLSFRFNPLVFLSSFLSLVRKAKGKAKVSPAPGAAAPQGEADVDLGDFDDDGRLPGLVIAGIRAFGKPIAFLLSTHDITANEFQNLLGKHRDLDALFKRGLLSKRLIAGADHTFADMAHKRKVIAETLDTLKSYL